MGFSSQEVDSVKVSFIKPFTLPNFTEKIDTLNQKFSFLSNSNNYSQYYKNLERGSTPNNVFQEIPQLGLLEPLRKTHALNSYWKSFRLTLKIQEKKGNTDNELFLLLPLKIIIPITSVKADGIKYPVSVYVYLFSFGSCCINMEIDIRNKCSLGELSKIIEYLKKSILSDGNTFEPFSKSIANTLNRELFGEEKNVILFPTHNFIFYQDTSELLDANFTEHRNAIATIIMGMTAADFSGLTEEVIDQKFQCQFKKLRNGEILIFNPESTFIYPSPIWVNEQRKIGAKNLRKKVNCMCSNYRSFLNVIFAVNRFLSDSFIENKDKLPVNRSLEIVKCFRTAFPDASSNSLIKIYFKNAFKPIAKQIHLTDNLNKIR